MAGWPAAQPALDSRLAERLSGDLRQGSTARAENLELFFDKTSWASRETEDGACGAGCIPTPRSRGNGRKWRNAEPVPPLSVSSPRWRRGVLADAVPPAARSWPATPAC